VCRGLHRLQSRDLVFLPTPVVNPSPQARRRVANLDSAAIDEDRGQLVLGVEPFRVAAMMLEVVDQGVALKD
jgi:hypothetical protein